ATTPTIYLCGADSESIKDADYVVFQPATLLEVQKAENPSMTIQAEPMNFRDSLAHLFVEQHFPVPASCWSIDAPSLLAAFPILENTVRQLKRDTDTTIAANFSILRLTKFSNSPAGIARGKPALIAASMTLALLLVISPSWALAGTGITACLCLILPDQCMLAIGYLYSFIAPFFDGHTPANTADTERDGTEYYGGSGTWTQRGGSSKGASVQNKGGNIYQLKLND
ncbi:MAG: hypothetical protein ACR2PT_17055, partial [Endozoicomonas sp.]